MDPLTMMAIMMGASAVTGVLQSQAAKGAAAEQDRKERIGFLKKNAADERSAQYQAMTQGKTQGLAQGTQNILATRQAGGDAQRAILDRLIQSYGQTLL